MYNCLGRQDQEPAGRKEDRQEKALLCFNKLKCYKKYKYLFLKSAFIYNYK